MSAPTLAAPIVRIDEPAYLSERRGSWADDVPQDAAASSSSQSRGKSAATSSTTNGASSTVAASSANGAKKNVQFNSSSAAATHLTVDRGYDEFDDGRRSSWANALLDDEPVALPAGFDSARKRKSSVGLLHFVSLDREDRQSDRLMMATPPLSPEGDTSRRSGGDYFGTPRTPTAAGQNGARAAGTTTTSTTPSRKPAMATGGEQKDETSLASVLSAFSIGGLFNSAVEAFSNAGAAIDPLGGREELIAEQRRKAKGKGRALDPIDPLAPPLSSSAAAAATVNGTPASARVNGHANGLGHAGHSDSIRSIDDVMVGGSHSSAGASAGRHIDEERGPALRSLPTSPVAVSGYPVASSSRMPPPSPLIVHRQPYSPTAASSSHNAQHTALASPQGLGQQANIYARAQGEENSSLEAALNSTFDGVEKRVKGVWNWFGQPGMGL